MLKTSTLARTRVRHGTAIAALQTEDLQPERLVGLGFRYWMLGRQTGNIECWERTWTLYSSTFGLCGARRAVGTLSGWVGALNQTSRRAIEVKPDGCAGFCRDECIAVSMIAACQHQTCTAMRACAFALIESSSIDRVVGEAQAFANTLAGLEQRLSRTSVLTSPAVINTAKQRPN